MRKSLAILPFIFLIAACGQPQPLILAPPADMLTCAPEPIAPDLPGREQQAERDRLMVDYVLGLVAAGSDCRGKLDGVRAWFE